MTASIREQLINDPSNFDPRKYLGPARTAIKGMVQHKMRDVLNCSHKI
jgi:fructose-bisphosphate aldolase class II